MTSTSQPDAPTLSVAVGSRLRALRESLHLSLNDLAAASGVPKGTLSRVERGTYNSSLRMLDTLVRHLGAELVDLLVSPSPEHPRHALVDATRGLSGEALHELLDLARRRAGAPAPPEPFRDAPIPPSIPRVPTVIPLLGLDVAAGGFDPTRVDRGTRYVRPHTRSRLHAGCFVARVIGHSMEPRIPHGAYVIFSSRLPSDLAGRIVLAQYGGHIDADTSASYTVKVFRGTAAPEGAAEPWIDARLEALNRAYAPIPIEPARTHDLRIVAHLIEVLTPAVVG